MTLNDIFKDNDNFSIIDDSEAKGTSYHSLIIGLSSFFSSYQSVLSDLGDHTIANDKLKLDRAEISQDSLIDINIKMWVHLQHFFELEVKKVLREENALLASEIKDPKVIYKAIKGTDLTDLELNNIKSIEFSEAIERLNKLYTAGYITNDIAKVFVKHSDTLRFVNKMRNAILHRGKRVLIYTSLDDIMCKFVLPLILELMNLPEYKKTNNGSFASPISALISPIIDAGNEPTIDYSKIALFKEIARCKLTYRAMMIFDEKRAQAEAKQKNELFHKINPREIISGESAKCPCCEQKTLLKIVDVIDCEEDGDLLGDEEGTSHYVSWVNYIYGQAFAKCSNCGFTISKFIGEMSEYGLIDFDSIWTE